MHCGLNSRSISAFDLSAKLERLERSAIRGTQKVVHQVRGTEFWAVNKFSGEREQALV